MRNKFIPELYKIYRTQVGNEPIFRIFYKYSDTKICYFNIYIVYDFVEYGCELNKFMKNRESDHKLVKVLPKELSKNILRYVFEELNEI